MPCQLKLSIVVYVRENFLVLLTGHPEGRRWSELVVEKVGLAMAAEAMYGKKRFSST